VLHESLLLCLAFSIGLCAAWSAQAQSEVRLQAADTMVKPWNLLGIPLCPQTRQESLWRLRKPL
jgi:hypothetical protein